MVIDEEIHLSEYNPDWVNQYNKEKTRILESLGNYVLGIEHIGSTSVPNLTAKSIIDILIGVKCLDLVEEYNNRLENLG